MPQLVLEVAHLLVDRSDGVFIVLLPPLRRDRLLLVLLANTEAVPNQNRL